MTCNIAITVRNLGCSRFEGELSFKDPSDPGPYQSEFLISGSCREYVVEELYKKLGCPNRHASPHSYSTFYWSISATRLMKYMSLMKQCFEAVENHCPVDCGTICEFDIDDVKDTFVDRSFITYTPVTPVPYITFQAVTVEDQDLLDLVTL